MPRSCRVTFADAAKKDLREIWLWIAGEFGSQHADRLVGRVRASCELLERSPQLGRPIPELGPTARALVVERYRVVYRIAGLEVLIQRVIDSRRDFPKAWRERDPDAHS